MEQCWNLWNELLAPLQHRKILLHAPGARFGFLSVVQSKVNGVAVDAVEAGVERFGLGPQVQPDIRDDAQLKAVIRAMPDGKLTVGSVVEDKDEVVFTITAPRSAVKAAVKPGDQLRIAKDGSVEIVPTGIPGLLDQLQRSSIRILNSYIYLEISRSIADRNICTKFLSFILCNDC